MGLDFPVLGAIPRFFFGTTWLVPFNTMLIFCVAALGINILVGVTGQVSLGHSFFMGVGAYTAVVLGGDGAGGMACVPFHEQLGLLENTTRCGLALPDLDLATSLSHRCSPHWHPCVAGRGSSPGPVPGHRHRGPGVHWSTCRRHASRIRRRCRIRSPLASTGVPLWRRTEANEDNPLVDFSNDGTWFGFLDLSDSQKTFFFLFVIVVVATLLAKNLMRTRTGRALQAIRDRDVAAEVMGVPEREYKRLGFAISSAYAGVGGALFAVNLSRVGPPEWNLLLAVDFIAILLIGGAGTIAGTLMGTFFVELLPDMVERFTESQSEAAEGGGVGGGIARLLLTDGSPNDFGAIATSAQAFGWPLPVPLWNFVIFGVLIVVFLIAEPLGPVRHMVEDS